MEELTIIEEAILDMIPRGSENKRIAKDLANNIGLGWRDVYGVINSLIKKGVPIVANRQGAYEHRGFYIATNEYEVNTGLSSLKEQVKDMNRRINAVENADLANWESNIIRPSEPKKPVGAKQIALALFNKVTLVAP